jgi:hypothetical protein
LKTYIGDSVYAEIEYGQLKLTTDNGMGKSNTIYLEPEIWDSLVLWVKSVNKERTNENPRLRTNDD